MNNIQRTVLSPRLPRVSRIAMGSLTVSGMQAALPLGEAARVLAYAFDCGINFIDTAQYYANYDIIREALRICKSPEDVVISTKTYAYSRELAIAAVEEARRELDRDVIDIFMLHEQESYDTMRGHREAYEYLLECRERGIIRAVGASTHHVALIRGLIKLLDEGVPVDVCHPLYNKAGIGIADGTAEEMGEALKIAHSRGIGIFGMKALGGGHLCTSAEEALRFVLDKPYIDAVAVGMQSIDEVDANLRFLSEGKFSDTDRARLQSKHRTLHVEEYCEGCGACVRRCGEGALRLVEVADEEADPSLDFAGEFARSAGIEQAAPKYRAVPDDKKCVRCGYCTKVCPVFALKVY
ncbi:MAG: 4Fe-4S dicluster domain-containing protein [Ruminococcaceae bacterium]|nr:4Fe-4S dicluster domain-containing protein [Oscillospiraceae bacterium]